MLIIETTIFPEENYACDIRAYGNKDEFNFLLTFTVIEYNIFVIRWFNNLEKCDYYMHTFLNQLENKFKNNA